MTSAEVRRVPMQAAINDVDAQLATELAMEISPIEEILSRHHLTKSQLQAKLENEAFRHMVREAKRVWKSDLSVKDRIRLKSAVLLEDSILELYRIFHDKELTTPARLDAFKSLAKVSAVDNDEKEGVSSGKGVQITFNFPGAPEKGVTINAESHIEEMADGREALTDGA